MADETKSPQSEQHTFLFVMAGTAGLGAAALGFSILFNTPLRPQIEFDVNDLLIGVIATTPLVVLLWWFSNTALEHLAAFRRSQIKFFSDIGFTFTPARIAVLAIGAGVSEELLFRGVLQTWMAGFVPLVFAIILSNVLFGVLHMRTVLYAFIAGLVGVYLGILYAATGNLLTPMSAHAFYDAVALEYTRRAVEHYKSGRI